MDDTHTHTHTHTHAHTFNSNMLNRRQRQNIVEAIDAIMMDLALVAFHQVHSSRFSFELLLICQFRLFWCYTFGWMSVSRTLSCQSITLVYRTYWRQRYAKKSFRKSVSKDREVNYAHVECDSAQAWHKATRNYDLKCYRIILASSI